MVKQRIRKRRYGGRGPKKKNGYKLKLYKAKRSPPYKRYLKRKAIITAKRKGIKIPKGIKPPRRQRASAYRSKYPKRIR